MLRISLIIALVASIAALVVSQIRVAEKINGLTTDLDSTKQSLANSQEAERKAKKDAKDDDKDKKPLSVKRSQTTSPQKVVARIKGMDDASLDLEVQALKGRKEKEIPDGINYEEIYCACSNGSSAGRGLVRLDSKDGDSSNGAAASHEHS